MQRVPEFVENLEGFARSEGLLGDSTSARLLAEVRRLILDASAPPPSPAAVADAVAEAVRALRRFERAAFPGGAPDYGVRYYDPVFGSDGPSRLQWARLFTQLAQRIRESVEDAEAGDPEAATIRAEEEPRQG